MKTSIEEIERLQPQRIVISPGPSTPLNAGICNDVIKHFAPHLPVLGVCLGHQCVGYNYGGWVVQADRIMHGKSSEIQHSGSGIFAGLPSPFSAIRYHSLMLHREGLPQCFEITAWTEDGTIMGLRHRQYPLESIQFHPESFLTEFGFNILHNFVECV